MRITSYIDVIKNNQVTASETGKTENNSIESPKANKVMNNIAPIKVHCEVRSSPKKSSNSPLIITNEEYCDKD